jgi:hypothetical protein
MQIAYTSKNGLQLPESMGYGFIDPKSIVETDNQLTANYISQISQKLVHAVTWDNAGCQLETFNSSGTRSRLTFNRSLQKALLYDAINWDLGKDPLYLEASNAITSLGNILVMYPGKTELNYYPAGKLMTFILPVKQLDEAYLRFKQGLISNKLAGLFQEQKGHYIEFKKELTIQNLYLVSFIVSMTQIHAAAKYFANSGIIGPDKPDRLIIDDCDSMRTKHMRVFNTKEGDGYYALLFQELTKQNYSNVIESFLKFLSSCKFQ